MSTGEVFLDEIPNQGLDRPLEIDALHLGATQSTAVCDPLSLKKLASAFPVAVAVRAKTSSCNSEPPSIAPRCSSQREVIMKSSKPGSSAGRCLSDKARLSGRRSGPSEQTPRCCRGERRA